MHGSARFLAIILVILVASTGLAHAADTGTVSGSVFDQYGQPVSDAAVIISGSRLPVSRTVQTGANGGYQFEYLPPGEYTLELPADFGRTRRIIIAEVGR